MHIPLDEHNLQNVQVILAVDSTIGQRWDRENFTIWLPKPITDPLPCFDHWEGSASTHILALQLGKEKNWILHRISLASIGLQTSPCDL